MRVKHIKADIFNSLEKLDIGIIWMKEDVTYFTPYEIV